MIIVEYHLFFFSSDRQQEYGFRPSEVKYLAPNQMYASLHPQQKEHPNIPTPLTLFDVVSVSGAGCMIIVVFVAG